MPAGVFFLRRKVVEAVFGVEGYVVACWVLDAASSFLIFVQVLHSVKSSLSKVSANPVEEFCSWFFVEFYMVNAISSGENVVAVLYVVRLLLWCEFCLDVYVAAVASAVALGLAAEYVKSCGFCYCLEGFCCLAD